MVNLGTQSGKVIIKVVRKVRAGCAQGKHSPQVGARERGGSDFFEISWVFSGFVERHMSISMGGTRMDQLYNGGPNVQWQDNNVQGMR